MRYGGSLFTTLGAALVAFFCYTGLLANFDFSAFGNGSITVWFLLVAYVVGIELAIVGTSLHLKISTEKSFPQKKWRFLLGLTLLTVFVLTFILKSVLDAFWFYPLFQHSSGLARFLIGQNQFTPPIVYNPLILLAGAIGGALMLSSGALSKQLFVSGFGKGHFRVFYLLIAGVAITLAGYLLYIIPVIPTGGTDILPLIVWNIVEPLGIMCLTIGWAVVATSYSKRIPTLLPLLFPLYVALTTIPFFIF